MIGNGFLLQWTNVDYFVESEGKTKQILYQVNGYAKPGEILAIMGCTGAGKTTLMDLLSRRTVRQATNAIRKGNITANGVETVEFEFNTFIGYVMQDALLLHTLTVWETLMFYAELKVKGTLAKREELVKGVLDQVQLTRVKDSLIGKGIIDGCSGGEKKRVTLACELLCNSRVLFLDEPTTGLDSYTALIVMTILRKQAEQNKTILLTVHQPSAQVVEYFDMFMLMDLGHCAYHGKCDAFGDHIRSLGLEFPAVGNVATNAIKLVHVVNPNKLTPEEEELHTKLHKGHVPLSVDNDVYNENPRTAGDKYPRSWIKEFKANLWRWHKHTYRDIHLVKTRFGIAVSLVLSALLMIDINGDESKNAFWTVSAHVWWVLINLFCFNMDFVCVNYPLYKPLVWREYGNDMYRTHPCYLTRIMCDIPIMVVQCVIVTCFSYYPIGLRPGLIFFGTFLVFMVLICLYTICWANVLVWLFVSPELVRTSHVIISSPLIAMSGFLKNTNNFGPHHWVFFGISGLGWCTAGMCINQFENEIWDCQVTGECDPLNYLGFDDIELYTCIIATCVLCIICYTVGALLMSRQADNATGKHLKTMRN